MFIQVENNVGRCKPVYDSIYQATDSVCIAGLNPLVSQFQNLQSEGLSFQYLKSECLNFQYLKMECLSFHEILSSLPLT